MTATVEGTPPTVVPPRLKTRYREEIVPALTEQFAYGNPMQIPGLVDRKSVV